MKFQVWLSNLHTFNVCKILIITVYYSANKLAAVAKTTKCSIKIKPVTHVL